MTSPGQHRKFSSTSSAAIVGWVVLLALPVISIAGCGSGMAQTTVPPKRLGILASVSCPTPDGPGLWTLLLRNLADRGWIEGRTLIVDCVAAAGHLERAPALAAELVAQQPDVLFAASTPAVRALKEATAQISIVTVASDPLRSGIVSSLARPDANITGLAPMLFDLLAKRTELMKELLPRLSRLAIIYRKGADPIDHEQIQKDMAAAAQTLGFAWNIFYPASTEDIDEIFTGLAAGSYDAAYIVTNPVTYENRARIARIALQHRMPTISETTDYAREGVLLSYGLEGSRLVGGAAEYVDKLLRGAKPADLPLQQPTKFELVINKRTAEALGVAIPPSLLLQADEVIE